MRRACQGGVAVVAVIAREFSPSLVHSISDKKPSWKLVFM
jgi:hypothetical protein